MARFPRRVYDEPMRSSMKLMKFELAEVLLFLPVAILMALTGLFLWLAGRVSRAYASA